MTALFTLWCVQQVEQSRLTASHDELIVQCDQQRAEPNLSAEDQLLLSDRGIWVSMIYKLPYDDRTIISHNRTHTSDSFSRFWRYINLYECMYVCILR